MKTKKFYIVESRWHGNPDFRAYRNLIFGIPVGGVSGTLSFTSANACEEKLMKVMSAKGFKPKIVRVVEI